MHYQSAFTLIEALIVLSIISILTLFTIPGLREVLQHAQDNAVRAELVKLMVTARSEAETLCKTVMLCKSSDMFHCGGEWSAGQLVFVDSMRDGKLHTAAQIIAVNRMQSARGSLHVRFYPIYRDAVYFHSLISGVNDNGTFWYCRAGAVLPSWAVKVNRAGNIEEMLPDANGEIKDAQGRVFPC